MQCNVLFCMASQKNGAQELMRSANGCGGVRLELAEGQRDNAKPDAVGFAVVEQVQGGRI